MFDWQSEDKRGLYGEIKGSGHDLDSLFATVGSFELFIVVPDCFVFLVLFAECRYFYLKRLMSSKISEILTLASSTFANLRFVFIGLKLANSKISDGRSYSHIKYLLDYGKARSRYRVIAHIGSS